MPKNNFMRVKQGNCRLQLAGVYFNHQPIIFMKHLKLGIYALMGIVGVTAATQAKSAKFAGTYYAVSTGPSTYRWTTHRPAIADFRCDVNAAPFCTLVTLNNQPADNSTPSSSQPGSVKGVYRLR